MIHLPESGDINELRRVFRLIQEQSNRSTQAVNVPQTVKIQTVPSASSGSATTIMQHNSLSGLQGGQAGQYYHLTQDEYSKLLTTDRVNLSCGIVTAPTFTDHGDGTCTIGSGVYNLYDNALLDGQPTQYTIAGGTFTPTDQATNYIVANYNSGTPTLQITTNVAVIDEQQIVPVFSVYRDGTTLCLIEWDSLGIGLVNKIHQSIVKTQRFRRESGLMLSEIATRIVAISAGVTWVGAVKTSEVAIRSDVDTFKLYYHSAGNWVSTTVTQYNNSQYDDGTNLQTLSGGKYAVNFIYRGLDTTHQEGYIVLGGGNYNLTQAQASQPPNPPPIIAATAVLVGRIIVLQGASTATQIDSAFTTVFTPSPTVVHNDLTGLQGGATGEYYHLSLKDYTTVTTEHGLTKEFTGFSDPDNVVVTYDSAARTVTLTGTVAGYYQGVQVAALTSGWTSPAHPAGVTAPQFLYYNGTSFVWSSTLWTFDMLMIALVIYDSAGNFRCCVREPHGFMDWESHREFHQTIGTYLISGGDISGVTLGSTTAANRRPDISATQIADEDLITTNPALTSKLYTWHYLSGAGTSNWSTGNADIVNLSGANPYYNQLTGGVWQQTLVANNNYPIVS